MLLGKFEESCFLAEGVVNELSYEKAESCLWSKQYFNSIRELKWAEIRSLAGVKGNKV